MPPYPALIERLRREKGITQSALAQRLNVSAMSVSRWERGVQEPSSQIFVRLGSLASDELRWEFWERAGLTRDQVISSAAAGPEASAAFEHVDIPLLDVHLGASQVEDFVSGSTAIDVLSAPADWCPHPKQTMCAFVEGDSMEPRIADGSVACFDTADRSPSELSGKIVVAQHPKLGTKIAWLEPWGDGFAFRSEDPEIPRVPLEDGWHIIGRLLWWLTRT